MNKLRKLSQLVFLCLFILLILKGKMQLWMVIFLTGVVGAIFLGRFFCGWICPIYTITGTVEKIYQKLGIKKRKTPAFLKKPIFRYLMLGVFLMLFLIMMKTGKKLPVLLALLGVATIITLFFPESLWHRYLCPYGVILTISGKKARRSFRVDEEKCINCGLCTKICPGEAVVEEEKSHQIDQRFCLECQQCISTCPQEAIAYDKKK